MLNDLESIQNELKSKASKVLNRKVIVKEKFRREYQSIVRNEGFFIEYQDSVAVYTNRQKQKIYIPNQWLYLAYLSIPLYKELQKYKSIVYSKNSMYNLNELKGYIDNARKGNLDDSFFNEISKDLQEQDKELLKSFLTENNGKGIERNDFYVSSILNTLKMINDSAGHLPTITQRLANHDFTDKVDEYFEVELTDFKSLFISWLVITIEDSNVLNKSLDNIDYLEEFVINLNNEVSLWESPKRNIEKYRTLTDMLQPKISNEQTIDSLNEEEREDNDIATREENTVQLASLDLEELYQFYFEWARDLDIEGLPTITVNKSELEKESRQIIFFGAPGTGKSYHLHVKSRIFEGRIERVTFHPNMTYGHFVGAFKPFPKRVPIRDSNGQTVHINGELIFEEKITYRYVPGPLIQQLLKAYFNPNTPHLLIIEELNRANAAAVFGDTFQLLDRNNQNLSEYPIHIDEALQVYLDEYYSKVENKDMVAYVRNLLNNGLVFPPNLYIWTTMNSSDQGINPLDTAFKRRWDQKYFEIDRAWSENQAEFDRYKMIIHTTSEGKSLIPWNTVRMKINEKLLDLGNIPEDKLLGPYFISKNVLNSTNEQVTEAFKSKVLMYLYDDVVKVNRTQLFKNIEKISYSNILNAFDKIGLRILDITE